MEDMFTYHGAHQNRYQVKLKGVLWKDVVCSIMQSGLGTALAYVEGTGKLFTAPRAEDEIDAVALIIMVRQDDEPTQEEIEACLQQISHK